jgi:hypothetical protein
MGLWTLRRWAYPPVQSASSAPTGDGSRDDGSLPRKREAEIAEEEHRLNLARLRNERERLELEGAERRTRSRVRRVLFCMSAVIGVAAPAHVIDGWVRGDFHAMSNFELVVSAITVIATEACALLGMYLASRPDRGRAGSADAEVLEAIASPDLAERITETVVRETTTNS